ncbi:Lcl domain-containing protein [Thiolapillus sp.]
MECKGSLVSFSRKLSTQHMQWPGWLSLLLLFLFPLPGFSAEQCNGVANKEISAPLAANTTCTATNKITVLPGVTVPLGDTLSLYAPVVSVPVGPVSIQGSLRVAPSNPWLDYVWATSVWGQCEGSCGVGQGRQYRSVWCETAEDGIVVPNHNCDAASEPGDSQSCTVQPPQCPATATNPLNDTGITWGGDYPNGNNATCTSNINAPQDCNQGRDATHNDDSDGHAGFSFTKLDANGNPLPPSAVSWSCVKDNITGLVWEVKTTDGGIHDKDNTYRWGGLTAQGSGYGTYYNDWDVLVNGSNSEQLCGFNDWRVPTRQELQGLVNYNRINPAIDTAYFPNTVGSHFWSSSPYANASDYAWNVSFYNGYAYYYYRGVSRHVRLVRSGQ